jgi:hypothetical protein
MSARVSLLRQARYREAEVELLTGYESLRVQANPSVSWLRAARADLVLVYEALQEPDKVTLFREEADEVAAKVRELASQSE